MARQAALWIALALLGIVATAGVAWFASGLAGPRIGLSSEPLSVAAGLAPGSTHAVSPRAKPPPHPGVARPGGSATPAPVTLPSTSPPPVSQPSVPIASPAVTTSQAPADKATTGAPASPPQNRAASGGHDGSGGGQSGDSNSGPDD